MKKLYQGLTIIATAALTACSSMEINDAEALSENYPSDFDAAVYLELHPVLMTMQILDYIKAENAVFKKTLSADSYNAKVTEDSTAFLADTASLHKLYVNPRYYGETEEKWVNFWVDKVDTIVDTIYVTKVAEVKLDSLDSAGAVLSSVKIYVDSVVMDSAGTMFTEIFGKTDTAATELTKFVVDGVTTKAKTTVVDTVSTKDSLSFKPIPAGLDSTMKVTLSMYNLYGVKKDVEALDKLAGDTEAAARQFVAFGKSHGWAYRRCLADEKANAAVDPVYNPVVYPATKLYCDDNGVAREIVK